MTDISFVRHDIQPEKPPPQSSVGIIGWLRGNLFSNWMNTLLTVVSIAFTVYLLTGLVAWTFRSVWVAESLSECREIMIATWGGTEGHACWAVIRERWLQLMFGFYPSERYWRPILAFVLLLGALAPVMFPEAPRRLLYLTAAYPFLLTWLMWGGNVWVFVLIAAGFVLGWAVYRLLEAVLGYLGALIVAVAAAVLWWFYPVGLLSDLMVRILPIAIETVESRLFGGFLLSTLIGVVAIGCSLPLGICLALGRQSDLLVVKAISVGFIEFIRGVPLITLLFVASTLLNIFMPPGTDFDIILRVMIMVTFFASAYMAETIRGGLAALPREQYEGAASLGLDYWKSQRLVIMPQALKISIPGIVSVFIGIFKDTTLVSIIGLLDPLGLSTSIRADTAWNGIYWELFAFIALLFFIFCFGMSRYSIYLEKRLRTDHH